MALQEVASLALQAKHGAIQSANKVCQIASGKLLLLFVVLSEKE